MNDMNLTGEELLARLRELEQENAVLRAKLGLPLPAPRCETAAPADRSATRETTRALGSVHKYSPPQEKIALFRSLFRGREDVYARRWQSAKTGKSGYSPACGNEWKPGICPKPKGYCADCAHRELLPLTYTVIDGRICWYGSVNILSFGKSEESVMRLESSEIAGELIDTVT